MTLDDASTASRREAQAEPARTTTLLVIRHAESTANAGAFFASQSDSPLTETGHRQAAALAGSLASTAIDAIYSSDLSRARDTATPLATARGLALVELPELRERHMGVLTGMSFDEARRRFPELWARMVARDPFAVPEGGESHTELAARARAFTTSLASKHRGQTLAIVSHGVAIHHALRCLIGIDDVAHPLWLAVDNASVSRVDLVETQPGVVVPKLAYINRVASLG